MATIDFLDVGSDLQDYLINKFNTGSSGLCATINCKNKPTDKYGLCVYLTVSGWIIASFIDTSGSVIYGYHFVGDTLAKISWTPGISNMISLICPWSDTAMRGYSTYLYRFRNSFEGNKYRLWIYKPGCTIDCRFWTTANVDAMKLVSDNKWFIFSGAQSGYHRSTENISARGSINGGLYTAENTSDTYFAVVVSPTNVDIYGYAGILVSPLVSDTRQIQVWRD